MSFHTGSSLRPRVLAGHPLRAHRRARRFLLPALLVALSFATGCAGDGPAAPEPPTSPPPAQTPEPPPSPTVGSLQVDLLDVPSGATPTVTVRGAGIERTVQASRRLDSLPFGTYDVIGQPVIAGGVTYVADPASQSATVSGSGATPRVTVRFRASGAAVALGATGLPSYARGTVRITGAGGFERTALTRDTVRGLQPGEYTLTIPDVETTDGRFSALEPTRTITLGTDEARAIVVQYVEAKGTITVSVAGLPGGAAAGIRVTGPGNYDQTVNATRTLPGLNPGLYVATASRVRTGGFSWDPDVPTRDAVITGVQQRTIDFTYAIATGAIAVSVTGLPAGVDGSLLVTGPGGFSRAVTGTTTLTDLAPGVYRVSAASVTSTGVTYAPSPLSRDVVVTASLVATPAPVTYEGGFGTLALQVTGIPDGINAAVTVQGPFGFSRTVLATDTLRQLVPGTYTITAGTVLAGSTQYVPTDASQGVTVAARETASRTVRYIDGSISSLALTVGGLPTGVSANVVVTGPNGFTQTVQASSLIYDLQPGSYTIVANTVSNDGFSYAGVPASQTVQLVAGQEREAGVMYAATTGRLTVSVGGLPGGASASVVVTGPAGFSQAVTASTTLQNLVPGTYVVSASNVTSGSTLYTPSASSQSVPVAAGATAFRTVTYSGAGTQLDVTISGLPGGASASVAVSGPGGYSQNLTASAILSGLQPGSYTLTASTVTSGGYGYAGTPASQTVAISAGQQRTAAVTYAVATGRLTVTISGLPGGTPANVSVTGPGGYAESLSATATLGNLAPGTYTVTASNVTAGATPYLATPASQTVAITAGATGARTVTYAAAPTGPNLVLDGAYVTQAIQNFGGTVSLVAGRSALLRVFVTSPSANTLTPNVRVRLFEGANNFRTFTINAPGASVPTAVNEATLTSSWNATLTDSDMRPGLRIQVDVDPSNTVAEYDEADNVWPRSGTEALSVRAVAPFDVVLVPVNQSANGLTGNVNAGNIETFLSMTRVLMPLGTVNASVRATYTTNVDTLQVQRLQRRLARPAAGDELRCASPTAARAHYYGVVNTSYSSGIAGFAYVPGRAGLGWDKPGSAARVAAHELGPQLQPRPRVGVRLRQQRPQLSLPERPDQPCTATTRAPATSSRPR